DFHLGTEGPLIVVATAVGSSAGVAIGDTVVVTPFLIPLRVGCEDTDCRAGPDAVASLPLLRQGNFVLVVGVVSTLRLHVVVANFQQGAHDWRPFVHRTDTHCVPGGTVVVVTIDVLIHTDVHQIPAIAQGDCTVVENT